MVVYKCKRIPDEGECIHIPQLNEENSFNISAEIRKFLPQVASIDYEHDYHGWNYFNASYINDDGGDRRRVHIGEGSYIIKRSDNDWSVYPEQTFEKMYNLDVITW